MDLTKPIALAGLSDRIRSVSFHPSLLVLALGVVDIHFRLWDLASPELRRRLTGHSGIISAVSFSRQGNLLAAVSKDGTQRIWDYKSGREVRRYNAATSSNSL